MARPRTFRRAGVRRKTTWVGPADQGAVVVTSAGATLLSSFTPNDAGMLNSTVVRTRGLISIAPNAVTADVLIDGAFGIGVVSVQAFAAGIASIPEPFDEASWDGWFVWTPIIYDFEFGTAVGVQTPANQIIEIDSKAMRKVESTDVVVVVA